MKIVFFGSGKFTKLLIEVLKKNFDLILTLTPADFKKTDIETQIKNTRPEVGVLANFGLVIPPQILALFPKGILNIHPSLLPKYRGPTPVQMAILNNEKKTGVTIIKLDEKIDHGPILTQVEEKILATDTAESLYERLFKKGSHLLPQTINQYINPDLIGIKEEIKPSEQDDSKATFTKSLTRQDGYINFNNPPPPEKFEQMIRAYYPWPGVWTRLSKKIIKFLPAKKIQVEGKKPMSYKDFLNGYPETKEWLSRIYPDF